MNWIASPTALEEMGEEQFRLTPVGAGPFQVVSNQLSTELVLERNPNYFEEGKPYLDRLIFRSIGSEQAAYQALLSGQADAFEGLESTPILQQAQANEQIQVTMQPPTSPYVIQLNTAAPPFDNQTAREAIYYATNVQAIREGLFDNMYPVSQMFTGPGGLFHHAEVPGYRTYDLQRARQLVQQVGGIDITLITVSQFVAQQVMTALQSQWQEAGMTVRIESNQLSAIADQLRSGDWQAALQTSGAYDPAAGVGVDFRFRSDQQYTGVHDPQLDRMLDQAEMSTNPQERDRLYFEIGQYISDNAYAPFLFAFAPANLAVNGVHGPGLTTKIPPIALSPAILWQDVWQSSE